MGGLNIEYSYPFSKTLRNMIQSGWRPKLPVSWFYEFYIALLSLQGVSGFELDLDELHGKMLLIGALEGRLGLKFFSQEQDLSEDENLFHPPVYTLLPYLEEILLIASRAEDDLRIYRHKTLVA